MHVALGGERIAADGRHAIGLLELRRPIDAAGAGDGTRAAAAIPFVAGHPVEQLVIGVDAPGHLVAAVADAERRLTPELQAAIRGLPPAPLDLVDPRYWGRSGR